MKLVLAIALVTLAACDPSSEPNDSDGGADAGSDDGCGPFGAQHGGHCDCEPGYEDVNGTCEAIGACQGSDSLEPDDRAREAVIWSRATEGFDRWLCPGDQDWFSLELVEGEPLEIVSRFAHLTVDINLALWEPGRDPRFDDPAVRTVGMSDEEVLMHAVRRSGVHLVRVSSPQPAAQGAYRVERSSPTE